MPYPPAPTFPAAREVGGERALPFLPSAPRMVKPKGLLGSCWPQDTASLGCGPVTEQKFGRLEQDLLEHRTPWSHRKGAPADSRHQLLCRKSREPWGW